jgi:hypothetical protein
MTDFDYRPKPGFTIDWVLRVSGYDEKISDPIPKNYRYLYLSQIESDIEEMTRDYEDATGASITRVHGSHGWRVFEWDNGAVHCYEWKHLWLAGTVRATLSTT